MKLVRAGSEAPEPAPLLFLPTLAQHLQASAWERGRMQEREELGQELKIPLCSWGT